MSAFTNKVNRLDWNVPIVTPSGTPTDEFQRKWQQQASANSSIPNLTTAGNVSAVLDIISAVPGSLLARGTTAWAGLPPNTAGFVLTDGGAGVAPTWQLPHYIPAGGTTGQVLEKNSATNYDVSWQTLPTSSGAPGSAMDDGTNFYLATIDSAGQLVLDGSGDPIFVTELLPATAIPALPYTPSTLSTRQVLTSGTTYTTPALCRQLRIRMVGGAGGGAGSSTAAIYDGGAGGNGTDTIFNAIHAGFGNGAPSNQAGSGASAGTGAASFRILGAAGTWGISLSTAANAIGGNGGDSPFGGSGAGQPNNRPGLAASTNSGSGGGGGGCPAGASSVAGGGGQAGEYAELLINNPAATYTYQVGAAGAAGIAGTGGQTGAAGGAGIIVVDEYY
jgi:hypothetical protein